MKIIIKSPILIFSDRDSEIKLKNVFENEEID